MISGLIVTKLRADPFIIPKLASYNGAAAIFSDVVPEKASFPNITVRSMIVSVRATIVSFNVYIDYWDHTKDASRSAAKIVCNHIGNKMDGYRFTGNHELYSDVRFRLLSGYAATKDEYSGVHYNLFLMARACRKEFSNTESY